MSAEFVTVATYRILPEAEAAKLHLEAEGLTTFLADAETVAMDWLLANAVGNIKLQVPPAQAEAAAALLEQLNVKRNEREQQSEDDATSTCLSCGAELPENLAQCPECGWSYVGTDDAE
jgi:hypothetical protein